MIQVNISELDQSRKKHYQTIASVDAYLDGKVSKPFLSKYSSGIGPWLYAYALAEFDDNIDLHRAEQIHARIYELASKSLNLFDGGDLAAAKIAFAQVSPLDLELNEILALIGPMAREQESPPPDSNSAGLTDANKLLPGLNLENSIKAAVLDLCELITGISMVGDNPGSLYNNAYTQKKLGWKNSNGRTLLDAVYPADREKVVVLLADIFKNKGGSHEIRLYNEVSGAPFWVQWDVMVIDGEEPNDPAILATISPEITQRRLHQQQLEAKTDTLTNAIDMAQLGSWEVDVDRGMVHFSARHQQIFGSPKLSMDLREAINYVVFEDRAKLIEIFFKALQSSSAGKFQAKYQIINAATGKKMVIQSVGQSYFDADGRLISFSGIAQDITLQKDLQRDLEGKVMDRTRELNESNRKLSAGNQLMKEVNLQLSRSNEDLQRFAYVASHDLQEPLRKILQFSSRLEVENQSASPKAKDYLGRMAAAAERMSNLIEDLLTFSRVSNGDINKQPVSVDKLIGQAISNLEIPIREKGATFQVLPLPTVTGNTSQLTQLFQNLISNAVKFSKVDENGQIIAPLITICCETLPVQHLPLGVRTAENTTLFYQISISDNGIGFDEIYLDRIFQVFQRLHGRSEYSGTGIGLAICQRVANNHGGAIWARSSPGNGATFDVYLPVTGQ